LKKAQILEAPISIPPISEQRRVVENLSSMDNFLGSTERAVQVVKMLRAGLLKDLLSGERQVSEAYDHLLGAA
jgi:restriction endonuclease S subunit